MAPEKSPAFQFYPRDFLSDERVLVMDCAARGAYITLLAVAWLEGSLPVDETALIRLAQTNPREWKRIRENVLSCFYQQDGRYLQKRLELERQKQAAFRQQASNAGKRSAERRLNARSTPVERTYQQTGNGNPTLLSSSSSSSSVQTPGVSVIPPTHVNTASGLRRLDRSHLNCAAHSERMCVPLSWHTDKARRLGATGDAELRAWYPAMFASLTDADLAEPSDFKVLDRKFAAWRKAAQTEAAGRQFLGECA